MEAKMDNKSIILLYSYHHKNTQKIANAISEKINASIVEIDDNTNLVKFENYDLVGFGAGIDSGKHYSQLLNYVEKMPNVQNKKAFIFSTSAIYSVKKMKNDHKTLRNLLENKGYIIIDEFSCKGFNTNSVLKYFGGMNKNRPNDEDIKNAKAFAEKLL
jgi:flavodoxin